MGSGLKLWVDVTCYVPWGRPSPVTVFDLFCEFKHIEENVWYRDAWLYIMRRFDMVESEIRGTSHEEGVGTVHPVMPGLWLTNMYAVQTQTHLHTPPLRHFGVPWLPGLDQGLTRKCGAPSSGCPPTSSYRSTGWYRLWMACDVFVLRGFFGSSQDNTKSIWENTVGYFGIFTRLASRGGLSG